MLMIRYGHAQTIKDDEDKPTGVRNVIDGDFASHFVYLAVGATRCVGVSYASMGVQWMPSDWWCACRYGLTALCAVMLIVESLLVSANNIVSARSICRCLRFLGVTRDDL